MADGALSTRTIAIAGLGLMGGSLALALRGRCRRLLAVDPDPETRRLAVENGIVDEIGSEPRVILPQADIVILAAPVLACIELLDRLPGLHPGSPLVMDLASTKVEVARAYERLPARFDVLPAHPMCGKETGGIANADAGLFAGAALAITPLKRTSPAALALGDRIASAIGSHPLRLSPERHDAWVARTSHVAYLLAVALAAATPHETQPLIGPGFRSTARLAGSDPGMMAEVLLTNRSEIRAALTGLRFELDVLEEILAEPDEAAVRRALTAGRQKYLRLLSPID